MTEEKSLCLTDLHEKEQNAATTDYSSLFQSYRQMLYQQMKIISQLQQSFYNQSAEEAQESDFLLEKYKEAQAELSRSKLIYKQFEHDLKDKEKQLLDSTQIVQQLQQQVQLTTESNYVLQTEFLQQTTGLRKLLSEQVAQNKEMHMQISRCKQENESQRHSFEQSRIQLEDKAQYIVAYQQYLEQVQTQLNDLQKSLMDAQNSAQDHNFAAEQLRSSLYKCEEDKYELYGKFAAINELMSKAQENYQARLKQLNEDLMQLRRESQTSQTQIAELMRSNEGCQADNAALYLYVQESADQNARLNAQIAKLTGENTTLAAKCEKHVQEKDFVAQSLKKLYEQTSEIINTAKSEVKKLHAKYNDEAKRNAEVSAQLSQAEQDRQIVEEKLYQAQAYIARFEEQVQRAQQQADAREKAYGMMQEQSNQVIERLKAQLATAEGLSAQLSDAVDEKAKQLLERGAEVQGLQAQFAEAYKALQAQTYQLAKVTAEQQQLKSSYEELFQQHGQMASDSAILKQKCDTMQAELADARQQGEACEQRLNDAKQLALDLQNRLNAEYATNAALSERASQVEGLRGKIAALQQEKADGSMQIHELNSKNAQLTTESERLFEEKQRLISDAKVLHKLIDDQQKDVNLLKKQILEGQSNITLLSGQKDKTIQDLFGYNQLLKHSEELLQAEVSKLRKAQVSSDESAQYAASDLAEARRAHTNLLYEYQRATAELEKAKQLNDAAKAQLTAECQKNGTAAERCASLEAERGKLAEKLVELYGQIQLLEQQAIYMGAQFYETKAENARLSYNLQEQVSDGQKFRAQLADAECREKAALYEQQNWKQKAQNSEQLIGTLEKQVGYLNVELQERIKEAGRLGQLLYQTELKQDEAVAKSRIADADNYKASCERLSQEVENLRQEIALHMEKALEKDKRVTELTTQLAHEKKQTENIHFVQNKLKTLEAELSYAKRTIAELCETEEQTRSIMKSTAKQQPDFLQLKHAFYAMSENMARIMAAQDELELTCTTSQPVPDLRCEDLQQNNPRDEELLQLTVSCSQLEQSNNQLRQDNLALYAKLKAQELMAEQETKKALAQLNEEFLRHRDREADKSNAKSQISELQSKLAELSQQHEQQITATNSMKQLYEHELATQAEKARSAREAHDLAEKELQKTAELSTSQVKQLDAQRSQLQEELELLRQNAEMRASQIEELNEQLRCAQEDLEAHRSESEQLQKQNAELQAAFASAQAGALDAARLADENKLLEEQIQVEKSAFEAQLEAKAAELEAKADELEVLREKLTIALQDLELQRQAEEQHAAATSTRVQELEYYIYQAEARILALQEQKETQRESAEASQVSALEQQVQSLTAECEKARALATEEQQKAAEANAYLKTLEKDCEARLRASVHEKEEAIVQLAKQKRQLSDAAAEAQAARLTEKQLEEAQISLKDAKEQLQAATDELQAVRNELASAQGLQSERQQEADALKQEIEKYYQQIKAQTEEIARLTQQIQDDQEALLVSEVQITTQLTDEHHRQLDDLNTRLEESRAQLAGDALDTVVSAELELKARQIADLQRLNLSYRGVINSLLAPK